MKLSATFYTTVLANSIGAFAFASFAAHATTPHASSVHSPNVVYGDDNRHDVYDVADKRYAEWASSTVGLFNRNDVQSSAASDVFDLVTHSYSEQYNLCAEERFFEQSTGAFCSGSLVAPDTIMTAGHCITSPGECANTVFVFGFAVTQKGQLPTTASKDNVYGCKQIISRKQIGKGADYAIIKLDRPVVGHTPLPVNQTGLIGNATPLLVIGHPAGLPTKVADGAAVRDASPVGYFTANLDTYGGNSGSAVFNTRTGLIEGILVRGERDYISRGNCMVTNVCESDSCRGEDVTKVAEVLSFIPHP